MKRLFNIFSFLILFAGITSSPVFAFYSDMHTNHWAYKQIKQLSEKGIVVGYPDGTFKPDEQVTRAEFASMAIKTLGQEHTTVAQPIKYTDIDRDFWAYDAVQKAVYFDLISNSKKGDKFRPYDSVSRAEAISIAVNSLTTQEISEEKALFVLKNYKDIKNIPSWFIVIAGKAEILRMIANEPNRTNIMDAERAATRAEVTAILYNMMEQAKLNPNAKLAEVMRKKTGDGYIIDNAIVQGAIGTIPSGSVVPVTLNTVVGSQISVTGNVFTAKTSDNYITKDKYILMYKGTNVKGQVCQVKPGCLFVRNGVLKLSADTFVTPNDQAVIEHGTIEVTKNKNKFMTFIRKVFKGEKLLVLPENTVYMKIIDPIKIDLTNGWIFE